MNKIGWCDLTINPISGCRNDCNFCYARKFAHRLAGRYGYPKDDPFKPTFHEDKLIEIQKCNGKRVFLDSMGDWFSLGVNMYWLDEIIEAIESPLDPFAKNTFLVLTKRPGMIRQYLDPMQIPENLWIGTSVTCQDDAFRIDQLKRALPKVHKFVSFEPMHGPIQVNLKRIEWAIIGQETGNRKGKIFIKKQWRDSICNQANDLSIPIYLKKGMAGPKPDGSYDRREEFPEAII